jgi:hypothetical protein
MQMDNNEGGIGDTSDYYGEKNHRNGAPKSFLHISFYYQQDKT